LATRLVLHARLRALAVQLRSARATCRGAGLLMPASLAWVERAVVREVRDVDASAAAPIEAPLSARVVVPIAAGAAAVFVLPDAHAVDDGLPPRLPPRIALAVAVQPAPGVELGGTAFDWARANPPAVSAAAATTAGNNVFLYMEDSL
jgi:hypothetical protein